MGHLRITRIKQSMSKGEVIRMITTSANYKKSTEDKRVCDVFSYVVSLGVERG